VDTIRAFADTNAGGDQDADEPFGVAEKTYLPGEANAVVLTPPADTNRVGEQHCG
jgi:hypothetical protein